MNNDELNKQRAIHMQRFQLDQEIARVNIQSHINGLRSVSPVIKVHLMKVHTERWAKQWHTINPEPKPPSIHRLPGLTGIN